jgi:hypothetical protein
MLLINKTQVRNTQTGSSCKISRPVSWVHITYTKYAGPKKANIFLKADFLSRVETDSFTSSNDFPITI